MPLNKNIKKVLVIGSGPIVIGQAAEFDYAGAQACRVLKEAGVNVVLVNSNPATIMTDQALADEIYLEPLTAETVKRIIEKEKPDSLLAGLGGQTGLTISMQLEKENFLTEHGVQLIGTNVEAIDKAEDRELFKETLEEIKNRKPDPKPWFRARVAIVGSEVDDLDLTRLLEEAGAMVVADRYCYGSFPGREEIRLNDDEDIVKQIARHYMMTSECPRYMAEEKIKQRRDTADRLAKEYGADGIIFEQMKYCDFWAFERPLASHILTEEYGWPTLSIDRSYNVHNSGQLRTRFQAFVEALEIKRIRKNAREQEVVV